MGAHRLYAHKAFKAKLPLRITLILLNTVAGMYTVYYWVRDHRLHHKYSDTDADPHNSSRGFFFAHFGWLLGKKHPAVTEFGKTIQMSDLEADKVVMFQKKYYLPLYIILNTIIVAVPVWLWNETTLNSLFVAYFFRYMLFLNIMCCVNSWAHFYGSKPYDKYMRPVESDLLSFLVVGEGWHNYHHTFPFDYQAGELGLHYSLTTCMIELSSYFGLAYDLKIASKQTIQKRILRTG
nr:unnamed protein product [Callosobruchus analis]